MKIILLLTWTLGGFLLLCGCHTASQSSNSTLPLVGTEWVLTELTGKPFVLSEGLTTPTFKLDATRLQASGTSGLNRFAGAYELNGNSLKFGPLMGTRRAGPPAAMAAEDAFLAALRQVNGWTITRNQLALTAQGKTLLLFENRR